MMVEPEDLFVVTMLQNQKVYVAGAGGFLGKYLVRSLLKSGAIPLTDRVELLEPLSISSYLVEHQPDYLINASGGGGGIAGNLKAPATIFHDNTVMALNILEASRKARVRKVLSVVTSCAYPQEHEVMREQDFFDGPIHETVACHGYAKRNIQLASSYYKKQYGLNAVCVALTTLYGPGAPTDPLKTKVLDALVKKFVDAVLDGANEVSLWGTGSPHREFLYVEDAANLILKAFDAYNDSTLPLNIGSGQECSVKELAELVASTVGFTGRINWDTSKPDGQYRKRLDLTRMKALLGDYEVVSLKNGILRTAEYYRSLRLPQ
jgi:GDP-L-fucose synthase